MTAGPAGSAAAFEPRVAAASLSGVSDAAWARRLADHVGAAFLGGVCLDEASRAAAAAMVADRNREEFLPEDPIGFVASALDRLADAPLRPGVNVRAVDPGPVAEAAAVCAARGAILEVNAHCRQPELRAAGCGESLLADPDRLCAQVRAAAGAGATVSVKVRVGVASVDLPATVRRLAEAGADAVHVDAMDDEAEVGAVAEAAPELFLVANNGVRDRETTRRYLALGADAVSVGRPTERPRTDRLEAVRSATAAWFRATERGPRP